MKLGHWKLKEMAVERIWRKLVRILEMTESELSPFFRKLKKMRTQMKAKNPRQKARSQRTLAIGWGHLEHLSLPPLAN